MRRELTLLFFLLPAFGFAADGPAFDCKKAEGEVPQLICKNPELAALDRNLDEVYRAALSKAKKSKDELRAEQRGWVTARDECGKEPNTLEICVRRNYQQRTGELQARYELVPAKGPYTFGCGADPDDVVIVKYFHTEPASARLERGDRTVVTWLEPAPRGAKFVGPEAMFWNKGTAAQIEWFGAKRSCEVRPTVAK